MAAESEPMKAFMALDEDLRKLFYDVVGFCDKLPAVEEPLVKVLPEDEVKDSGSEDSGDEDSEDSEDEDVEKVVLPDCLVLFTKAGGVRDEIYEYCTNSFDAFKTKMGWGDDKLNENFYDLVTHTVNVDKKYSRLFSFFTSITFKTSSKDIMKVPLYYLQNNDGVFYSSLLETMLDIDSLEERINMPISLDMITTEQFEYYIELCRMRKIHTFVNEKGRGLVSEEFNNFHSKYGFEFVCDMITTLVYLQDVSESKIFNENEREAAHNGVLAWMASVMKAQGFGSKDLAHDVRIVRSNFYPKDTTFEESAEDVAKECDVDDDVIKYLSGVPDDELDDVACHDPLAGLRAEEAAKAAKEAAAKAAEEAAGADGAAETKEGEDEIPPSKADAEDDELPPVETDEEGETGSDSEAIPSKVARIGDE